MQYRRLGSSGLSLSALSFGSWVTFGAQIGRTESRNLVACAWDHGINFFDNAEGYANGRAEAVMGDVIADLHLPRDGFCVSSKVFFGSAENPLPTQRGLSRKHVVDACHASLRRLRVDYLDLFFCHRPDPDTPISETVHAMNVLVEQGKVLYWGTSQWSAAQIGEANAVADAHGWQRPSMEQPHYNLLERRRMERELAPLCEQGLGTTTWSPLASGLLTGKYNAGVPAGSRMDLPEMAWLQDLQLEPSRLQRVRAFTALANEMGVVPGVLAIAWCLRNRHVSTVILGASRVEQLAQNLSALALEQGIGADDWARVEAIFTEM